MFGFWKGWLVVLAILVFSFGARAATRVEIPASSKGPLQALIDAHQSTRLLYALEHKNGRRLKSSEYRRLPDKVYYLPSDAKPLASRRRVNRSSTATVLRQQLNEEKKISQGLRTENEGLKKQTAELSGLRADVAQLRKDALVQKPFSAYKISWIWIVVAILVGALLCLGCYYLITNNTKERHLREIADLKVDKNIATGRAKEAEAELKDLIAKWDNIAAVRARLTELEETRHATMPP